MNEGLEEHINIFQNLRGYQLSGIEWLVSLYRKNRNGILADEMGLGKTIQVLGYFRILKEECNIHGPHIIILPLSVINSWESEINRCQLSGYTEFGTYIHYGERKKRKRRLKKVLDLWKNQSLCSSKKTFLLFFTYDMVIRDIDLLLHYSASFSYHSLIVDEAHRLKNSNSVLYEDLMKLSVKHKILLTGTPLQNSVKELLSLLHFIHKTEAFKSEEVDSTIIDSEVIARFGEMEALVFNDVYNAKAFLTKENQQDFRYLDKLYNSIDDEQLLVKLQEALKPYILRRTKEEVCADLPPKVEKIIYCPQSQLQKALHSALRKRLESVIEKQQFQKKIPRELRNIHMDQTYTSQNVLIQLRKICNHSYLFLEDFATIPDDLYFQYLLESSGKLAVLDRLLSTLLSDNSKILIFSQMTTMLNILEGYLQLKHISYCRLDGSTSREERESAVDTFQNDRSISAPRIFLLSTRAGGVGINLQQADTVILYDSDWNPQQDIQAISRAHRIGQAKPVLIIRLVSLGPEDDTISVDEHMIRKAQRKRITEQKIFEEGKFNDRMKRLSEENEEELMELWFQEDETEMESIESNETLEKIVVTLFAKRDELLTTEMTTIEGLSDGKLYERTNQKLEYYTAPNVLPKDPLPSCWNSWIEKLLPSSTAETSIHSSPRKRKSVIRYENEDALDPMYDLNDDSFFAVKRMKNRRNNNWNSAAAKSLKKKRKRSSKYSHEDTESVTSEISEGELCCVCNEYWVCSDQLVEVERLFWDVKKCEEFEKAKKDLCDTLIVCDGCEGSFHALCVGLASIPRDEWFCCFCLNS